MNKKDLTDFRCKQCGNCCKKLNGYATTVPQSDIEMWESNGREDILRWVSRIQIGNQIIGYDIWIDPDTGADVDRCPWLNYDSERRMYACEIHDVKPFDCREYPYDREEALKIGCRGFEK